MVGRRVGGTFGVFAPPRANPEEALPVPPLPEKEGPDSVDILVTPIVGKVTGAGCRLSGPPERGVTDPTPHKVRQSLPSRIASGALTVGRGVGGAFGVFAPPRTNPYEALPVPTLTQERLPDSVEILVPP